MADDSERTFISSENGGYSVNGRAPRTVDWGGSGACVSTTDARGNTVDVGRVIPSKCGVVFDEYVLRALDKPLVVTHLGPSGREVTDLWQGRRLKVLTMKGDGQWKEGRVDMWQQWCSGFLSPRTLWYLTIKLDDNHGNFLPGDIVQVNGLQGATEHNGAEGMIQRYVEDMDRFEVRYSKYDSATETFKMKSIAIRAANLKQVVEIRREVCRCNVVGGGTLLGIKESDAAELLSFHWIDEPEPAIDLNHGTYQANCPTCRAVGPYQGCLLEENATASECPVCLQALPCIQLCCSHKVCRPCWESWCLTSSGELPTVISSSSSHAAASNEEFAVEENATEYGDSEVLEARRNELWEEHMDRAPTLFNPPDVDADGYIINTSRREEYKRFTTEFAKQLVEDSNSGIEGLEKLRQTLMEYPISAWENSVAGPILTESCSIAALEVIIEVLEKRVECNTKEYIRIWEHEGLPRGYSSISEALADPKFKGRYHEWLARYYQQIGRRFEEKQNFRAAIPVYKKELEHMYLGTEVAHDTRAGVSDALASLAFAHEKSGFLGAALRLYSNSMEFLPSNQFCSQHQEALRRDISKWRGTCGKLPREEVCLVDVPIDHL